MGKGNHIAALLFCAANLSASPASADTPDDPLRFFAHCTGRMSAELSHLWIRSSPDAAAIEVQRTALLEILELMTPPDMARTVLSWRLDARSAHAALISRAAYRDDAWARDRAAAEIATCSAYIVGPPTPSAPAIEPTEPAPFQTSQPLR